MHEDGLPVSWVEFEYDFWLPTFNRTHFLREIKEPLREVLSMHESESPAPLQYHVFDDCFMCLRYLPLVEHLQHQGVPIEIQTKRYHKTEPRLLVD